MKGMAADMARLMDQFQNGGGTANPPPLVDIQFDYQCATCEDRGVIRFDLPPDDPRFGRMFPCPHCEKGREYQTYTWNRRLREVGLPLDYQSLTFERWDALPPALWKGKRLARSAAFLMADHPKGCVSINQAWEIAGKAATTEDVERNWLVLQGPRGCGKTGLAASIINWRLAHSIPSLYMRALDVIENVQRTFDKNHMGLTDEEIIDEFRYAPFLVLDDMNVDIDSPHRREIFEKIVRARGADSRLATVITCNITPAEMEQQWGGRTTSIIKSKAHWIPMGGPIIRDERPPLEVY
jgi:DNA replication protein DnaC